MPFPSSVRERTRTSHLFQSWGPFSSLQFTNTLSCGSCVVECQLRHNHFWRGKNSQHMFLSFRHLNSVHPNMLLPEMAIRRGGKAHYLSAERSRGEQEAPQRRAFCSWVLWVRLPSRPSAKRSSPQHSLLLLLGIEGCGSLNCNSLRQRQNKAIWARR